MYHNSNREGSSPQSVKFNKLILLYIISLLVVLAVSVRQHKDEIIRVQQLFKVQKIFLR